MRRGFETGAPAVRVPAMRHLCKTPAEHAAYTARETARLNRLWRSEARAREGLRVPNVDLAAIYRTFDDGALEAPRSAELVMERVADRAPWPYGNTPREDC